MNENSKPMRYGIILAAIFMMASPLFAQPASGVREKVEAYRIAYYTENLPLSPAEAKVFWPVYDQFQAERKKLREAQRLERMELQVNFDNLSDKEVEDMLNEFLAGKQTELDLYRKYIAEFRKVLPAKKVARLVRLEQEFRRKLLEKFSEGGRPGGPPRGGEY